MPRDLHVEVRYESVVADPVDESRKLCDFLHVAFDRAMVRVVERGRRFERPPQDWTTQMPREHVEEFEAAAGEALDAFGYARAVPAREASS